MERARGRGRALQLCVFTCTPQLLTAAADCSLRLWATRKVAVGAKAYAEGDAMGEIRLTDWEDERVSRAEGWAFPVEATLRHIDVYRSDYCLNIARATMDRVAYLEVRERAASPPPSRSPARRPR